MGLFGRLIKKSQPESTSVKPESNKQVRSASKGNKRKTLSKNFDEMLKEGDIDALKSVFDKCALDAYGGYYKQTALAFAGIPDELVCWLVEQGADINAKDNYGGTPLHRQCATWHSNTQLLVELGADIEAVNDQGETPLHTAACAFIPDHVRMLVENGATIHAKSKRGFTPLPMALSQCQNLHISRMAEIAAVLLKAGAPVTEDMKKEIERIGTSFEFFREEFSADLIDDTVASLDFLYRAFEVTPVPKRKVHDVPTQIKVSATRWQDQHQELWELLVPASGHAKTVQGEAIRITGRIFDEIYRNGGVNWDADYRKMLKSLKQFLNSGTPLSPSHLEEVAELTKILKKGSGEAEAARLTELAVRWVFDNPMPVLMEEPDYKR